MRLRVILFLATIGCFASLPSFSADAVVIPKDLFFERKPLRREVNAFTEWNEADKLFVRADSEDETRIQEVIERAWSPTNASNAIVFPAVNQWIQSNAPALALIEKGLAKERAQFPKGDSEKLSPFLLSAKALSRIRLVQADQAAGKGDHVTATNLLLGNLKLTRMIAQADVPMINYLVARSIRTTTEKAIVRWAWRSKPSAELTQSVLKSVPSLDDEPDIYEHVLRVEFTEFICAEMKLKKIQKQWIDAAKTNGLVLMFQPEELQRALFIVHDPRLLALHPKPLDIEAGISYETHRFRQLLLNTRNAWRPGSSEALSAETERVRAQYVKDLQPLLNVTKGEEVPLTKKAAKKAANYYLKLTNPVGRYWQSGDVLNRTFVTVFQTRTEREATRALLALRIYKLKHGHRAESLEDLVKGGLLDRIPMDYFGNGPLRYSAAKEILWSVAEDGVDNGGVPGKPAWQKNDMVWEIPVVKADEK